MAQSETTSRHVARYAESEMVLLRRLLLRRLALLVILAVGGCSAPVPSGPVASPRVSCVGIPATRCNEAVATVARSLPNTMPVSIEVTCVAGTCTPDSGAMDTVVTLADGSQLRSTTVQWSGGGGGSTSGGGDGTSTGEPPPGVKPVPAPAGTNAPVLDPGFPVVPVEPICQGVPVSMCRTMAETAFGEVPDEEVAGIVVRCGQQACTDEHGAGETEVTYADGQVRISTWEYQGG